MPKQFDLPQANLQTLMRMTPSFNKRKSTPGKKKPRAKVKATKSIYQRKAECKVTRAHYGAGSRKGFQRSRPQNPIWYNEMRAVVTCATSGKKRYSYVRFYGPPNIKTPVWVWCSCEHFAYTYEWVLAQIGCSSVSAGYDNRGVPIVNKPPDITNEHKKVGLCKHLLAAAEVALRQTKDFAAEEADKATERGAATRPASTKSPTYRVMQW